MAVLMPSLAAIFKTDRRIFQGFMEGPLYNVNQLLASQTGPPLTLFGIDLKSLPWIRYLNSPKRCRCYYCFPTFRFRTVSNSTVGRSLPLFLIWPNLIGLIWPELLLYIFLPSFSSTYNQLSRPKPHACWWRHNHRLKTINPDHLRSRLLSAAIIIASEFGSSEEFWNKLIEIVAEKSEKILPGTDWLVDLWAKVFR